jgi:hypothetical protein
VIPARRLRRTTGNANPAPAADRAGEPVCATSAIKHGRYTAQAIANRRDVAALIRAMRALACATEEAG